MHIELTPDKSILILPFIIVVLKVSNLLLYHFALNKWEINPSTEMSPVLLRSLGKRFHRRFGWQRANFLAIDNPSPLKSCTGCRVAQYCSLDCQKADWSSHRTMCKTRALEKAGSPTPGSDCEGSLRPDGQYRCEHCEQ